MWLMEITLFLVVVHVFVHTTTAVLSPSCTFDNGWCQWQHQNSTRFEWHLGNGSTTDISSGPVGDHTTKYRNGSYIFIKGIEARMNSSIKAVVEADIDVTSDLQISFWYFMNGVGIGILTLNKMDGDGSKTELWRREGRQGPEWIQATVSLPRGSFVISFEASARLFYGSDLAVDDIEITPIRTTTNLPPSTILPAMELPFDCDFDFESGSCGLELVPSLGNTVGWNITSGPVSYKGKTLISGDVSGKREGKYLLLNDWNVGENGDTAQIISPVLESTGAACLRLYLATSTSGTLYVYQKLLPSMELVLLREVSYSKPFGWKSLMFTLKGAPYFQVILEGSYSDSRYYGSVIGVDDFTIKNGECVLTTTPRTTERTSPKISTTELKVPATQVSISSRPTTTQASTTLPSSSSHVSSPYSTQASTTTISLTTKRVQPSKITSSTSGSSTSKSGHTSSYKTSSFFTTQKPNTTISSVATNSQITTKSPSHVPWLSSIQTSKTSTLSSSVTTATEKETVISSSKSSSQSSLQTYISSMTTSLLSSKRTVLTTKSTIKTSNIITKTTSSPSSVTLNTAKPTSQKSNSSTLSPSSTSPGSTSVMLSSLFTNVATFTFQLSSTWITTGKSERSTSGKHTSQHTSTLSSGIPEMKTTASSMTEALTSSHTTGSSTSSRPASINEANKLAGRETTAIVLGVCLPIIALVILSVIVLICKKDHSKHNSVQAKKKVWPCKVEKPANADSIEMNDNVFVKGFRKLET